MGLPTRFPKLRGDPTLSRAQDAIDPILRGQGQALSQTPLMGALPVWTQFSLLADFVNIGTVRPLASYYKDAFGIVRCQGALSTAAGQGAFTPMLSPFPMGLRPKGIQRIPVRGTTATFQSVVIGTDGSVTFEVTIAAGGTIDLAFAFLAEQ
jgi:hypothetical protein